MATVTRAVLDLFRDRGLYHRFNGGAGLFPAGPDR